MQGMPFAHYKGYMSRLMLRFSLMVLTGCLLSSNAFAGGSEGGGNGHASKFFDIAKNATMKLKMVCAGDPQKPECRYLEPLKEALLETTVTAQDIVLGPDAKPRDAGNNGKDTVIVSKTEWDKTDLSPDSAERWIRTAIHEFAVIKGLENNDVYGASAQIVTLQKNEGFDFSQIVGKLGAILPHNPTIGGIKFKNVHQNSDGSITLTSPTFMKGGRKYRIAYSHYDYAEITYGAPVICNLLGMDLIHEDTEEAPRREVAVSLTKEGRFLAHEQGDWNPHILFSYDYVSVLTEVTCMPKKHAAASLESRAIALVARGFSAVGSAGTQDGTHSQTSAVSDRQKKEMTETSEHSSVTERIVMASAAK